MSYQPDYSKLDADALIAFGYANQYEQPLAYQLARNLEAHIKLNKKNITDIDTLTQNLKNAVDAVRRQTI